MSVENVAKFEELLRSSEDLQAKFAAASEAYEGSRDDERAVFEAIIAPLAQEAGLPFTYDEGMAYASSPRELNDAELDAVAGGGSWCYVIGGSESADTWACTTWDNGAGACGYIGIGFMWNDYD